MYATHEGENDPSNPNRKNKDEKNDHQPKLCKLDHCDMQEIEGSTFGALKWPFKNA